MVSPGGPDQREAFDDVLAAAQDQERSRLRRYRRWWIVRHVGVLGVALAVLAVWMPTLLAVDPDRGGWLRVAGWVFGGWVALLIVFAMAATAALVAPLAVARIVAVLRADDLAAFERSHAPWWAERGR